VYGHRAGRIGSPASWPGLSRLVPAMTPEWLYMSGIRSEHERDSRLSQLNFAYHWRD